MRFPRLVLRRENVDTNRLKFFQVADRMEEKANHFDHVVMLDAKSGILYIVEMERERDKTPKASQLPMPELCWQWFKDDAEAQERAKSSLRMIWIDTRLGAKFRNAYQLQRYSEGSRMSGKPATKRNQDNNNNLDTGRGISTLDVEKPCRRWSLIAPRLYFCQVPFDGCRSTRPIVPKS